MTITVVFDPPLPSDSPATFNTKAFNTLGDLNDWSDEANALATAVNSDATTAGTGASTATTQAGIATTKAGEASASALAADASADAAAASAASVVAIEVTTHAATSKTTPVDADEIPLSDSAASWGLKKLTWANIKATLKTYLDTLYQAVGTYVTPTTLNNGSLPASVTTLAASGNVTLGDASTDTLNVGNGGIVKDASGNVGIGVTPAGSFNLAFPIAGDKYIGKIAVPPHSAGNACRLDLAIVDGAGYSGVSVRNSHDGTYSSQEVVISTSWGGIRLTADMFKVDKAGNALVIAPYGGLGYGTGAGGTVTQATSKATGVTLNKPVGQITMNNAALGAAAFVTFQFTNSLIAATDLIVINIKSPVSGLANYRIQAGDIGAGYCWVSLQNVSAGPLSDAVVLNFAIIKGATS